MADRPVQMLLLASYFKGERFMQQAKARGAKCYLLTQEKLLNKEWPRDCLEDVFAQQNDSPVLSTVNTVSYLARRIRFDCIVGLDDFDVEVAASLREHLRIPGMGETVARHFRDKLACRIKCREEGIPVPDFTPVFNDEQVAEWIARVPAPWMLKPRSEASATGITKVESAEQLWQLLEERGDRRSHMLLEQYLPGDVCHADALTNDGKVVFAEYHRCGTPPFNVAHGGGVFTTTTIERGSKEEKEMRELNEKALTRLGQVRGASHIEFIRAKADGKLYLLETAARVGGAHIAETVEASTGINLWAEWANLEVDAGKKPYELPKNRKDYAGLLMCLAKEERPDLTTNYNAPEVVFRAPEPAHAGLIVRSPDRKRVLALQEEYEKGFHRDFLTFMPPPVRATH